MALTVLAGGLFIWSGYYFTYLIQKGLSIFIKTYTIVFLPAIA
jgi:hypothetical protein